MLEVNKNRLVKALIAIKVKQLGRQLLTEEVHIVERDADEILSQLLEQED